MKKLLLLAFAACMSISAFGAQLIWSAYSFPTPFDNGTAYVVEMNTGAADRTTIASKLTANGIKADAAFSSLGSAKIDSSTSGFTDIENQNASATYADHNYFVIAFDSDKKNFALSEVLAPVPNAMGIWNAVWNEDFLEDYWTTGTVGGGEVKPVVPEPTVLALLALGVAGLALRRRA